jgi:hypothetical protein
MLAVLLGYFGSNLRTEWFYVIVVLACVVVAVGRKQR